VLFFFLEIGIYGFLFSFNLDFDTIFFFFRMQIQVTSLTNEVTILKERIQTADSTIGRQTKQLENLTIQLGEAERTLKEKEEDMEDLEKTYKQEVLNVSLNGKLVETGMG